MCLSGKIIVDVIAPDKSGYQENICLIVPQKNTSCVYSLEVPKMWGVGGWGGQF